jgi:tetratricopeptide (TPR) repeat protein
VDRTVRPAPPPVAPPPPPPTVQVMPLSRPGRISPETGPVVPENRYSTSVPSEAQAPVPVETSPAVAPAPAEISRQGNDAVVALLDNAAAYVGAGDLDMAAASLERALRIEPRNASIWHDLGQIRLHQRKFEQAESLATKSNSLAGDNSGLKVRNWRLIAMSRRSVGDGEGADAAEAQATLLAER